MIMIMLFSAWVTGATLVTGISWLLGIIGIITNLPAIIAHFITLMN